MSNNDEQTTVLVNHCRVIVFIVYNTAINCRSIPTTGNQRIFTILYFETRWPRPSFADCLKYWNIRFANDLSRTQVSSHDFTITWLVRKSVLVLYYVVGKSSDEGQLLLKCYCYRIGEIFVCFLVLEINIIEINDIFHFVYIHKRYFFRYNLFVGIHGETKTITIYIIFDILR